jgi:hypothetical protein
VEVKGCSFHITQAMFKHLKKIGMGPIYQKDKATRKVCREILSLNLLPAEKIAKRFNVIVEEVRKMRNNVLLKSFCNYIELTWIKNTVWPPQNWSMFMQHRRTNNNAEGKKLNVEINNER